MAINRLSQSTAQSAFPKFTNFWDGTTATSSFDSLGSVYVSTATSTITFSSIPQTYQHLQIRHIARNTNASTSGNMYMRFNGDTGNNYVSHRLEGYNTGVGSGGGTTQAAFTVAGLMTGASSISGAYGMGVLDILDYTNTSKHKTIKTISGYDNNGNGSAGNDQGYINVNSGVWFKAGSGVTSDAVTSITITINGGGNFDVYTQFSLYGVK